MRDIITIDIKEEKYYKWLLQDLIEIFEDYDFPCWSKDDKINRIQITDVKTRFDIQRGFLHIEILIQPKETLCIPIKLKQISLFQYDRIQGIKGKEK